MDSHRTVADIISSLGISALAREFGHENVSTVSSWKLRGSIPVVHWPRLVEFAAENGVAGISYETLVEARTQAPVPHNLRPIGAAPQYGGDE